MSDIDTAVRSIVPTTLGAAELADGPLELSAEQWPALRSRMFGGNLPGVLAAAVEAGNIVVGEAIRAELFDQMLVRLVNDLRAESECVRVTQLLARGGIESVVLKGLAVAHLDYPDPSHRSTTDVDLLVRSDDIERAAELLADAGFRRDLPERRRGFDRRFAKDITLYGPRRVEVDLHRTLLRGPFGVAIDLDELWGNQEALEVHGLPSRRALDKPSRLLHASYTVAVADARPTLANLCDVALLARDPEMDWDLVQDRADRWRAGEVVRDAVSAAAGATGLRVAAFAISAADSSARRWRRLYDSGGGSLVETTVGTTRALGPVGAIRYLRDLAFPGRAYVRARRRAGRRSEVKAALHAVRRRLERSSP